MDIDKEPETATTAPKKQAKHASPSASAESASPHPSMSLAQDIHRLTMFHTGKLSKDDATKIMGMEPETLLKQVMEKVGTGGKSVADAIKENEERLKRQMETEGDEKKKEENELEQPLLNPSLYQHLVSTLSYSTPLSSSDLNALKEHHIKSIDLLKSLITKAQDEAGDMEVLAAKLAVARYSTKSCTKEDAIAAYEEVVTSPKLSIGKRLDSYLEMARVCSFWGDYTQMSLVLEKAAKVIEKGGDWDRRNRLKAYTAVSHILVRDLEKASKLLVDGIATFSCTELCEYPEFITYAVVTSLLYLPRTELKKCVIDGSEILQVAKDIPVVVSLPVCGFVRLPIVHTWLFITYASHILRLK